MTREDLKRVARTVQNAAEAVAQRCRENNESDMRSVISGISFIDIDSIVQAVIEDDQEWLDRIVSGEDD